MTKEPSIQFADILDLPAMTVATVGKDAIPHAATVYFVTDSSLNFYYLSSKHSQHIQDLIDNPNAAVTIFPLVSKWQEIRGLQMKGNVQEVTGGLNHAKEWGNFAIKFPDIQGLDKEVLKNQLYVFKPTWIRMIDNRDGFGSKRECSLETIKDIIKSKEL